MKTRSILFAAIICAACVNVSTRADSDAAWQKDCRLFVQRLADLAPKASGGDQFEKKEVLWDLTFKEVSKNKEGKEEVQFDLEPFGIKQKFFSGKPVMMGGFAPAPGTIEAWKKIKPDSKVKVKAVVANVFFASLTPDDNPNKSVPIAVVSMENVTPVQP
jgi:hypothetical protein